MIISITLIQSAYSFSFFTSTPNDYALYSVKELYCFSQKIPDFFKTHRLNLLNHENEYLKMLDTKIQKRIGSGPKANQVINVTKASFGLALLGIGALGANAAYFALYRIYLQGFTRTPLLQRYLVLPLGALATLLGFTKGTAQFYKGLRYKKRMQEKYTRDRYLQRHIRDTLGLLDFNEWVNPNEGLWYDEFIEANEKTQKRLAEIHRNAAASA